MSNLWGWMFNSRQRRKDVIELSWVVRLSISLAAALPSVSLAVDGGGIISSLTRE